jgi:hypothetical protein
MSRCDPKSSSWIDVLSASPKITGRTSPKRVPPSSRSASRHSERRTVSPASHPTSNCCSSRKLEHLNKVAYPHHSLEFLSHFSIGIISTDLERNHGYVQQWYQMISTFLLSCIVTVTYRVVSHYTTNIFRSIARTPSEF